MTQTMTVELGARSYDIHVGSDLLPQAGSMLAPMARGAVPVVTDDNVAKLHLERFCAAMRASNIDARPIILAAGESTKSFAGLEKLSGELLETGVDRGGLIVALGGGVIGDLTGLAAGLLKRGIEYAQVPTTLLAQVDSSVGGKTAINTAQGKNLVGLFNQPRIVIADTAVLTTLPRRELLAGYAEVAKYGALGDQSFFEWLESNGTLALLGDSLAITHAVAHSCRMKAAIVARDERESAERALLNLGHTFGHALEAATGYSDRLLHGEGVAIGMALAFRLSVALGVCSGQDADRFTRHLDSIGLPSAISAIPGARPQVDELLAFARSNPQGLHYGSAGNGTPPHMTGEMFKGYTGIALTHVPYKGGAPAIADLVGGQIVVLFDNVPPLLPHVRSGRMRAIAVTSLKRISVLPDTPTLDEAGLKGFDSVGWNGVIAPAGTPSETVRRLSDAIAKVLRQPDIRDALIAQGAEPVGSTPEAFGSWMRAEVQKWAKVVRDSGAKVD
jgi:3-dehydroquinate synthase